MVLVQVVDGGAVVVGLSEHVAAASPTSAMVLKTLDDSIVVVDAGSC